MWGKGIATEAIQLVCKFGFEKMNLHKIEAGTYADAVGSQRALEKNGFLREGTFRDRVFFDGIWMDVYRYGLLRDELKSSTNRGGVRTEHIIRNRDKPAALWSRKAAA